MRKIQAMANLNLISKNTVFCVLRKLFLRIIDKRKQLTSAAYVFSQIAEECLLKKFTSFMRDGFLFASRQSE
jgi:hypothetical protein